MRLLSDESGATKTECGIITAGMSFAVAIVALPQGATFMHSLAGMVVMLTMAIVTLWPH